MTPTDPEILALRWGDRYELPGRRYSERQKVTYENERGDKRHFYVGAGFHPTTVRLLEAFIRPRGQFGTDECRLMDDVGVLISLCLQYGCPLDTIIAALGRLETKPLAAHSAIGCVADALSDIRSALAREMPKIPDHVRNAY